MKAPPEFDYLVTCFHPLSMDEIGNVEEWIMSIIRDFTTPEMRKVVKTFLDEVLSGDCPDEELEEMWARPAPTINFSKGGHRAFLGEIRKALDRKWPEKRKR